MHRQQGCRDAASYVHARLGQPAGSSALHLDLGLLCESTRKACRVRQAPSGGAWVADVSFSVTFFDDPRGMPIDTAARVFMTL